MSGRRYLACLSTSAEAGSWWRAKLSDLNPATDGLEFRFECGGCVLLTQSEPLVLGPDGVIVGDLIRAGTAELVTSLTAAEISAIIDSRGTSLIDRFWGGYVALIATRPDGSKVLRAPMGDLACYQLDVSGATMIASDLDLLIKYAGLRPSINWMALADHLLSPDLRHATTCIADVREMMGGERLTVTATPSLTALWSPWTFVPLRSNSIPDDPTPEALRQTICMAVAARASKYERSVLLLSGGLDSSIVAAAMARWRCRCDGLTMVTRDRAGDERGYARAVAEHIGMPLHEVFRDRTAVEVTRSAAAGLPYPAERSFAQATSTAAIDLARQTGAGAILNGGGGDHVFCSIQSAAPVTDLLRTLRIGSTLWRTVDSISRLAQVTNAAVAHQAIARLFRRGPLVRVRPVVDLLSPDAAGRGAEAVAHPWLCAPAGALPGSATHVGNIVRALSIVHSPDARASLPSIPVLLAQPIVEACLGVPSWRWLDKGHNRAFARHAFSTMLPDGVIWRRSKGAMSSFMVELFEANRKVLLPFLLDGLLAGSGLIDRSSVEAVLRKDGPVKGEDYGRVLEFADTEAWLRSWACR